MIYVNVSIAAPTLEAALEGLEHAKRKAADRRELGHVGNGVYEGTYTVEEGPTE